MLCSSLPPILGVDYILIVVAQSDGPPFLVGFSMLVTLCVLAT